MSALYVPSLTHPRTPAGRNRTITKVLGSSSAEPVTTEQHLSSNITVVGRKAAGVNNGSNVYVGFSQDSQEILVSPGLPTSLGGDVGLIDTADLWIKGTSGDGCILIFQEGLK